MRILIDIGHPGHVHLLKHTYFRLIQNGHDVWVTVKDIPIAKILLKKYNIEYIDLGKKKDSLIGKALTQIGFNFKIFQLVRKNQIEIGLGTSMTLAHISKLSNMKSIIFDDDDDHVQPLFVKYAHPFADIILSPESIIGNRKNNKAIFYPSFHELAYLHPNRFTPDFEVLQNAGIKKGDVFFIMRFNVFKAHHDVGISGMSLKQKLKLIEVLEPYGKILITTERNIEPELKKYQLLVSAEKAHSLMYYATMFLGDSQTMTSEAAVLGTPAIKCNSFAGKLSVPNELEEKYDLCYSYQPDEFNLYLNKVKELIKTPNLKGVWQNKKEKLLLEKSDITEFYVWFIENYPKSKIIMMNNSNYEFN
ncbi:DUF354 domain-containing protein [Polaribacter sp.]|nr:DUF354 domain-containing protein [Polaribacter sp.]